MVKGTSRQVILVQGPEEKLFEQAIFILKDRALGEGVTDEQLLKEAESALHSHKPGRRGSGVLWATLGAMGTGLVWLLTALF